MTSPLKKISSTGAIKVGIGEKLSLDGTTQQSHQEGPKRDDLLARAFKVGTGFKEGELQVVASASKVGKSIFAGNVKTSNLPVSYEQVEALGAIEAQNVGATAEKIVKTLSLSDMGDIGGIVAELQVQADRLDPAKYTQTGLVGKVKGLFFDMKKTLLRELQTAEAGLGAVTTKIHNHIDLQNTWIKNLEAIYNENYTRYQGLVEVLKQTDNYIGACEDKISKFVVDESDPEYMMRAQELADMHGVLYALKVKKDAMTRLKALTESNSPKIRQRQQASRAAVATLNDICVQVIPVLKVEFALFVAALDNQKSINLINNTKSLVNKTLVSSSDAAYTSSIAAAKAYSDPTVTTETLLNIRSNILKSIKDVSSIEQNFLTTSDAEIKKIESIQKELLKELIHKPAAI